MKDFFGIPFLFLGCLQYVFVVVSGLRLEPVRCTSFDCFRTAVKRSGVCLGDVFVYVAACVVLGFLSPGVILR